jgi:SAM-dependent methyltransferase
MASCIARLLPTAGRRDAVFEATVARRLTSPVGRTDDGGVAPPQRGEVRPPALAPLAASSIRSLWTAMTTAPSPEGADHAVRALSFGAVAVAYDRFRPAPPQAAVEWFLPQRVEVAVDVAAGTGALARHLLGRVDRVIAVEPDERMAAVLAHRLPQVQLLIGRAESLPLADASADAVLVSSAWHWLDHGTAVPEIARVLRPGGLLGICWTGLDRESARGRLLWEEAGRDLRPRRRERSVRHRPEDVRLPEGAPFGAPQIARLHAGWRVSPQHLAEAIGTYSSVITLPEDERERLLAQVRVAVATNPAFAGRKRVTVPLSCRCWKARRL